MQTDELISAVRQSTKLTDNESAGRAVRATLTVLGRRLKGGETRDLAAQLPADLKDLLPADGPGEQFDVSAFYEHVADEEGGEVTVAQARQHARATAKGLEAAVSAGEWQHLASQLPEDYADLLGTETVQNH